jgi:DNA-binding transcriptional LysR family regulator
VTLRQFEVFLAVARARSFRRAAEGFHLSQPALSQHVRELEAELGARLFDRLGRAVHLTEAGRILEDHASRLFASLADARREIAELHGLQRGSLAIGASTTPGIYVLPGVLGVFRQRHPAIEITMQLGNSEQVEAQVRAGGLDLGVIGDRGRSAAQTGVAARVEDELVLVVPPAHPWARRRDIRPEDLTDQPLLLREPGSATRLVTERTLAAAGVAYRPGMVLPHTEAIKQGVLAGLGVAFVSVYAIRGEQASGRLRALRIRGLRIVRHFHLIHHERRRVSAAARTFIELLASGAPGRPARRGGPPSRPRVTSPVAAATARVTSSVAGGEAPEGRRRSRGAAPPAGTA